jgi:hypothetical protein
MSSFGLFVWSAGHDGQIGVWDARKVSAYVQGEAAERMIGAHTSRVLAVERMGRFMITGSFDMSIVVYDGKVRLTTRFNRQI